MDNVDAAEVIDVSATISNDESKNIQSSITEYGDGVRHWNGVAILEETDEQEVGVHITIHPDDKQHINEILHLAPKPTPVHKINSARNVAVAVDYFWQPDMQSCPRGVKVQLLGAGGVAVYGVYMGEPWWEGWAPLPQKITKTQPASVL